MTKKLRYDRIIIVSLILIALIAGIVYLATPKDVSELPEKPADTRIPPDLRPSCANKSTCGSQDCAPGADC